MHLELTWLFSSFFLFLGIGCSLFYNFWWYNVIGCSCRCWALQLPCRLWLLKRRSCSSPGLLFLALGQSHCTNQGSILSWTCERPHCLCMILIHLAFQSNDWVLLLICCLACLTVHRKTLGSSWGCKARSWMCLSKYRLSHRAQVQWLLQAREARKRSI